MQVQCKASDAVETCSLEWQIMLLHLAIWWTSLGLALARRTALVWLHCAKCEVWWVGDYGVGLFFRSWIIPCSNFVATVWGWPLPVLTWLCTSAQRSIKTWMREFGVDELNWPAQRPDLNTTEHLWDELEQRLQARPSHPTSVCDLTNRFWKNGQKFP